jgi:hypothetical protein
VGIWNNLKKNIEPNVNGCGQHGKVTAQATGLAARPNGIASEAIYSSTREAIALFAGHCCFGQL